MGSGFRTWTTGEVVTASNVNNYLQEQTVMSFADSSARDAAVTSPEEGMVAVLRDTNKVTIYNGSVWIDLAKYDSWETFTPVWSADSGSTTLGNGTLDGRFIRLGALIIFTLEFTWGTTTTQSVGGANWRFDGPNVSADTGVGTTFWMANAWALDASAGTRYVCHGQIDPTTTPPRVQTLVNDAATNILDNTNPFTWANSDRLNITGIYGR